LVHDKAMQSALKKDRELRNLLYRSAVNLFRLDLVLNKQPLQRAIMLFHQLSFLKGSGVHQVKGIIHRAIDRAVMGLSQAVSNAWNDKLKKLTAEDLIQAVEVEAKISELGEKMPDVCRLLVSARNISKQVRRYIETLPSEEKRLAMAEMFVRLAYQSCQEPKNYVVAENIVLGFLLLQDPTILERLSSEAIEQKRAVYQQLNVSKFSGAQISLQDVHKEVLENPSSVAVFPFTHSVLNMARGKESMKLHRKDAENETPFEKVHKPIIEAFCSWVDHSRYHAKVQINEFFLNDCFFNQG